MTLIELIFFCIKGRPEAFAPRHSQKKGRGFWRLPRLFGGFRRADLGEKKMDHILSRDETKRLMHLLGLPMPQWGNFPLMRKAFLTKCKILHPDKGGDQELAKELIGLYKRAESAVAALNPEEQFSTTQVCSGGACTILKDMETCPGGTSLSCVCLFCLLRDSHREKEQAPKLWGRCYCYKCFITWFGLEDSTTVIHSWISVLGHIPFAALNI